MHRAENKDDKLSIFSTGRRQVLLRRERQHEVTEKPNLAEGEANIGAKDMTQFPRDHDRDDREAAGESQIRAQGQTI